MMRKNAYKIALFLLLALVLFACNKATPQTVETTHFVSQTVEVTKSISQTVVVTRAVPPIITATKIDQLVVATPTTTPTKLALQPNQDTAYYDGIIVISRFCTLFGQGLYEQAYDLLTLSSSGTVSLEEYIKNSKILKIHTYKLISAQPYHEWVKKQGRYYSGDSWDKKWFYVSIYAEGEGGAGAVPNGVHEYFALVVWEKGEWKLAGFDTAPPR